MEFRAFGGIEVLDGDRTVDLGPRMHKAVLAILLVSADRVVSTDRLIDQLWDGDPPASAANVVQAYVSNLRRALEPRRPPRTPPRLLLTQDPGYLLRVTPAQFDVARFEILAAEGRAALHAGPARLRAGRDAMVEALALWRETPYLEFATEAWIRPEITRLSELRAGVHEDLAEARLTLGEHAAAVSDLETHVAEEPLRERGWELLALALYRCGRQADALRALARIRSVLAEELGLQPRPSLEALEADILRHAPSLEWSATSTPGGRTDDDGYFEVVSDLGRQLVGLTADRVTIGRSSASDIHVPDSTVSRNHAAVERAGGGWAVRDMGSANGTFVNGRALGDAGHVLQPGDEIAIGGARLYFRSRAQDAASETVGADGG